MADAGDPDCITSVLKYVREHRDARMTRKATLGGEKELFMEFFRRMRAPHAFVSGSS